MATAEATKTSRKRSSMDVLSGAVCALWPYAMRSVLTVGVMLVVAGTLYLAYGPKAVGLDTLLLGPGVIVIALMYYWSVKDATTAPLITALCLGVLIVAVYGYFTAYALQKLAGSWWMMAGIVSAVFAARWAQVAKAKKAR